MSITLDKSALQLQLSVSSKISVAAVASNIAKGGAWRRNKADLSDLDFWIPISRNYIDSLTDSVMEAEPEHLGNMFYVSRLAWPMPYLYVYILFSRPKSGEILSFQLRNYLIWFNSLWIWLQGNFSLWRHLDHTSSTCLHFVRHLPDGHSGGRWVMLPHCSKCRRMLSHGERWVTNSYFLQAEIFSYHMTELHVWVYH